MSNTENPVARTFSRDFNARLGQFTRNPSVRTPEEALTLDLASRLLNERQREEAAEKLERQEYAEKIWSDRVKAKQGGGSSGGGSGSDAKFGALNQDAADLLTEEHNSGFMAKWDIPGWVPGNERISETNAKLVGTAATPLKFALDVISRGSYGGFEGMKEFLETQNEGENALEALDNTAGGIWSGLKANEKTGFGEVIEAQASHADSANPIDFQNPYKGPGALAHDISDATRVGLFSVLSNKWARDHGREGTQQNLKRAGGLFGEIGLDPTNLVGGKVFTTVGDAIKGGDAADDLYRVLVRDTVDEAIDSRGLTKPFDVKKTKFPTKADPTWDKFPEGRTLLHEAAQRGIDNATLRIGGGATQGRFIGSEVGAYTIADNVSNEMRNFTFRNFDQVQKMFDDVIAGSKTLTKADIQKLRKDPIVAAYLDKFLELMRKEAPSNASLQDVERILAKYSNKTKDDILRVSQNAATHAKSTMDDMFAGVREDIFNKLDGQVKNIPGIRVAGKDVPFKRLGKAYHAAKAYVGDPAEAVQFGKQFPSITPQLANRVKSTGQEAYEAFHADVQDVVKSLKLTRAERKGFNQRILDGTNAPTARLQAAQDFLQRAYRQMWQDEVDAGLRSADEIMPNNYVYNYYKPRGLKKYIQELDNYRKGVKLDVKTSKSLSPNHIVNAQRRGLKVEQDAFRSLLYRKLKSNRQLTQSWFKESLLDNFGIMANKMSKDLELKNRLAPINSTLTKRLKDQLVEKGDSWYLPEDINNVFKKYMELTGGNATNEMSQFVHMIDTVTRWFKQSATIYYPGFHVRNSMGDMFMSFIDGVRASDYTDLKRIIARIKKEPNAPINIGGHSMSWDRIKHLFDENVSTGGFKRSDFDTVDIGSKIKPTRATSGIREASEKREDLFRFTHFLHAFKEELPKAMKNTKNTETAIQTATRASAYRVNKYLFDYGATTMVEKKYLKRVFPFYTYARKAMPALMEGMYLHPSQFSKTNRFFLDDDDGSYADMLTPQYLREAGYRDLSGGAEENPWLLSGQWLPTDMLNKNTNIADPQGFARNWLAQSNPFVKAGPEIAAGKTFWNDKPIEGTGAYFADSFAPPIHPSQDLWGALKGLPGVPGSGDKKNLLTGRFGLGIPISQVTNSQQTSSLYGILDEYKKELGKLNPKLEEKGFRIYVSPRQDGASFRIANQETGAVVFDSTSIEEAVQKAKDLSK